MTSFRRQFDRAEGLFSGLALLAMVILLAGEMSARSLFGVGIPGSQPLVQHLTLWVAFLGAALAASEEKLLALATPTFLPEGKWRRVAKVFASAVAAAVSVLLLRAALEFLLIEREVGDEVALGIPVWVALLVLPVAFALITLRLIWKADEGWLGRGLVALAVGAGIWLGYHPEVLEFRSPWPGLVLLVASMIAGAPIFA